MGIGKGCGEKMGNSGVLYCHMMMIGMGSNPIAEMSTSLMTWSLSAFFIY
jgi:hypothetical protein